MDFSTVVVDLTPVFGLTVTIVTALIGLIAVRKVVKTANRT